MLTKYEAAKKLLELRGLPPKQLDNLEVLERQIFDIGFGFYSVSAINVDELTLDQAKEKVRELVSTANFLATMHLVVGCDIHHFRAISLAHYIEVPPEMQIDDIISRLTTRDCDVVHDDTPGHELFGENQNTEKGKEEGKEKGSPHTPYKEKGQEEREKDDTLRARAREGDCDRRSEEEAGFDIFFETGFWPEYPRKVAKKASRDKLFTKFKAAKNKGAFMEKVIHGLLKWKKSPQWNDSTRFIPYPLTWINQERWNDEGVSEICYTSQKPKRGVSQTANVKSNRAEGLW